MKISGLAIVQPISIVPGQPKDPDRLFAFICNVVFPALYLFGRWFEPFLVRRRFRKAIDGTLEVEMEESDRPEAKLG